jgi:hypothetical protein
MATQSDSVLDVHQAAATPTGKAAAAVAAGPLPWVRPVPMRPPSESASNSADAPAGSLGNETRADNNFKSAFGEVRHPTGMPEPVYAAPLRPFPSAAAAGGGGHFTFVGGGGGGPGPTHAGMSAAHHAAMAAAAAAGTSAGLHHYQNLMHMDAAATAAYVRFPSGQPGMMTSSPPYMPMMAGYGGSLPSPAPYVYKFSAGYGGSGGGGGYASFGPGDLRVHGPSAADLGGPGMFLPAGFMSSGADKDDDMEAAAGASLLADVAASSRGGAGPGLVAETRRLARHRFAFLQSTRCCAKVRHVYAHEHAHSHPPPALHGPGTRSPCSTMRL